MGVQGVVKFYNSDKGFGFIKRNDGEADVFVHATALSAAKIDDLVEGDKVSFEVVEGNKGKGLKAVNLKFES